MPIILDPQLIELSRQLEARMTPHREALREMCEQNGYGWVMQQASEMWAEKSEAEGFPGGNHTTGPCQATLDSAGFTGPDACLHLLSAWRKVPESIQQEARRKVVQECEGEEE